MRPGVPTFGRTCRTRAYGTFARVLGSMCARRVLTLEEAVRKMSALPAQRWASPIAACSARHEGGPGRVRPGTVKELATFERPHQYAEGISTVIVNGQLALCRREDDRRPRGGGRSSGTASKCAAGNRVAAGRSSAFRGAGSLARVRRRQGPPLLALASARSAGHLSRRDDQNGRPQKGRAFVTGGSSVGRCHASADLEAAQVEERRTLTPR